MPAIHFGGSGCTPAGARLLHVRTASSTKSAPKSTCDQDTASVVVLSDAASPARNAMPLTTARATAHPMRNIGPFTLARLEKSIRITAMIGTGLMATPMANGSTSAIPMVMALIVASSAGERITPGGWPAPHPLGVSRCPRR